MNAHGTRGYHKLYEVSAQYLSTTNRTGERSGALSNNRELLWEGKARALRSSFEDHTKPPHGV